MTKGLTRGGFDLDLRAGQMREGELGRLLALKGNGIEVKSEGKTRLTGNAFLEVRQKGEPSGISISQADWWAEEYAPDCWLIAPIEFVRELAREAWHRGLRRNGGDFNLYEGVLVPTRWWLDYVMRDSRALAGLCRMCGAELAAHQRSEGVCDGCLRMEVTSAALSLRPPSHGAAA